MLLYRYIRKTKDAGVTWATLRAIDLGLMPGHQDYVRFVIIGTDRSGSNFLRGLLNAHPSALALGEIFRGHGTIGWDIRGHPRSRKTLALFEAQPAAFLQQTLFRCYPRHLKAVGFKLFYHHARDGAWRSVWDFLKTDRGIRVIHLKRRNMLEAYLSRCRADRTGNWINTHGAEEAEVSIPLDYEGCLEAFEQTRRHEQACDRLFAGHDTLGLTYEDLAGDYAAQFGRVQAFLGLEPRAVKPTTFKQSRAPLPQAISNYAELRRRFTGTPWAGFFDH
jgi:LPS sulfotransferase NodH